MEYLLEDKQRVVNFLTAGTQEDKQRFIDLLNAKIDREYKEGSEKSVTSSVTSASDSSQTDYRPLPSRSRDKLLPHTPN